jgi:pimeloyl-ACP methyl ester carboxylesterase
MSFSRAAIATIAALATALSSQVNAQQTAPTEMRIPVTGASLFARVVGKGTPVIVLHGGPNFDHRYLLPDLDRLSDFVRLIYYDQRGRGKSVENVRAEDVTLASALEDLDRVREHFRLESAVLLGHSWGALLALEYALRHPTRVSQLILMNPAPVSATDLATFRKAYMERLGAVGTSPARSPGRSWSRCKVAGTSHSSSAAVRSAQRCRTSSVSRNNDQRAEDVRAQLLRNGKASSVRAGRGTLAGHQSPVELPGGSPGVVPCSRKPGPSWAIHVGAARCGSAGCAPSSVRRHSWSRDEPAVPVRHKCIAEHRRGRPFPGRL